MSYLLLYCGRCISRVATRRAGSRLILSFFPSWGDTCSQVVVSSPECDAALPASELLLHLEAPPGRRSALSLSQSRSARVVVAHHGPAASPANLVLGAAADEVTRMFARDGPREHVVSKNTWQGWRNEARRRRLVTERENAEPIHLDGGAEQGTLAELRDEEGEM